MSGERLWGARQGPLQVRVRPPDPQTRYAMNGRALAEQLEQVLAGELVADPAAVERQIVRSLGALIWLQQRHHVDARGRCAICRPGRAWWWLSSPRCACTVQAALNFHLHQPERFVLSTIADARRHVHAMS